MRSHKGPLPADKRLKLELINLDDKKHVLNIVDSGNYNFPKVADSKIPHHAKAESTVLLPRPLNFESNSRSLFPKKSGETSFALESPIKDPRYYSRGFK